MLEASLYMLMSVKVRYYLMEGFINNFVLLRWDHRFSADSFHVRVVQDGNASGPLSFCCFFTVFRNTTLISGFLYTLHRRPISCDMIPMELSLIGYLFIINECCKNYLRWNRSNFHMQVSVFSRVFPPYWSLVQASRGTFWWFPNSFKIHLDGFFSSYFSCFPINDIFWVACTAAERVNLIADKAEVKVLAYHLSLGLAYRPSIVLWNVSLVSASP